MIRSVSCTASSCRCNTDNNSNQAQIREVQFWVSTRKPEDVDTE